jgi:hypothetical protein
VDDLMVDAQAEEAAHEEEHLAVTVTEEVAMIVVLEADSKEDLTMVTTEEVVSKEDLKETATAEVAVADSKDVHLKEEAIAEAKVDSKENLKVVLEKKEDLVLVAKVVQVLEEEEIKNSLA